MHGTALNAVSYTHLDVYKRQDTYRPLDFFMFEFPERLDEMVAIVTAQVVEEHGNVLRHVIV